MNPFDDDPNLDSTARIRLVIDQLDPTARIRLLIDQLRLEGFQLPDGAVYPRDSTDNAEGRQTQHFSDGDTYGGEADSEPATSPKQRKLPLSVADTSASFNSEIRIDGEKNLAMDKLDQVPRENKFVGVGLEGQIRIAGQPKCKKTFSSLAI